MFEHDHSAARGKMNVRELIVFKHESEFGNTQAYRLFDTVKINRNDETKPARRYSDYKIRVDLEKIPKEVQCIRMI